MALRPLPSSTTERLKVIKRWENYLNTRIPIVRIWLNQNGLQNLTYAAENRNPEAAAALSRSASQHPDIKIRSACHLVLNNLRHPSCITAIWQVWTGNRNPDLLAILTEKGVTASRPPLVRVLSLIQTGRQTSLRRARKDDALALLDALKDPDPHIQDSAREILNTLSSQEAINAICQQWLFERSNTLQQIIMQGGYHASEPPETVVFTALLHARPDWLTQGNGEIVRPLILALNDRNEQISRLADFTLRNLQNPEAIQEFCSICLETRNPTLEEILVSAGYSPIEPLDLQIYCLLKLNRMPESFSQPVDALLVLLNSLSDPDKTIQDMADRYLNNLKNEKLIDGLCQIVINQAHPEASEICDRQGYFPHDTNLKAIYLFIKGEWEAYLNIDFDHRIIRSIYTHANPVLRRCITTQIQESGRVDFLEILSRQQQSISIEFSIQEIQLQYDIFTSQSQWDKLWELAQTAPLDWSVRIIRQLVKAGYRPAKPEQAYLFDRLADLAAKMVAVTPADMQVGIPPAIRRAVLKVSGRVNNFSFSPDQHKLAIGTGSRKVVIWDIQAGKILQVVRGFNRSIGQVEYASDAMLWVTEKTVSDGVCNLYMLDGDSPTSIGSHSGSITVLLPLPGKQVLTAARDQQLRIWDKSGRTLAQTSLRYWPRCHAYDVVNQTLALFTSRPYLFSLPEIRSQKFGWISAQSTKSSSSIITSAVFNGQSNIITGHVNGSVLNSSRSDGRRRWERSQFAQHRTPIRTVIAIPNQNRLLVADTGGEISFYSAEKLDFIGQLQENSQITTVAISPDGSFLAVGLQSNDLVLYDLRLINLPQLVDRPMVGFNSADLALLMNLKHPSLPDPILNGLEFMIELLHHRFRFDIHVSELTNIYPGEFDIVVD